MVANMGFNLIFVLPLMWLWNIGHLGLAMATACSAYLNVWLLHRGLKRDGVYSGVPRYAAFWLKLATATVVMAVVLILTLQWQQSYAGLGGAQRILQLAVLVGSGGVSFCVALLASGFKLQELRQH